MRFAYELHVRTTPKGEVSMMKTLMCLVASMLLSTTSLGFQQTGEVVPCGGSKPVHDSSTPPTNSTWDVEVPGVLSDAGVINAIETLLARKAKCAPCPPGQTGCAKSASSTYTAGTLTYTSDGNGNVHATVNGLKVTVSCALCTGT